jgi:hypothetical protein
MTCHLHIPQPFAFRALFEGVDPALLLFDSESFDKKDGVGYHPIPLLAIGLPVMTEKLLQIPGGEMLF